VLACYFLQCFTHRCSYGYLKAIPSQNDREHFSNNRFIVNEEKPFGIIHRHHLKRGRSVDCAGLPGNVRYSTSCIPLLLEDYVTPRPLIVCIDLIAISSPVPHVVGSRDTSPRSIEEKFASSGTVSPHEVTDEREEFRGGEVFAHEAIHMFHGLGSGTRVDHDRYVHFYLLELAG